MVASNLQADRTRTERSLAQRPWTSGTVEERVRTVSARVPGADALELQRELDRLVEENHRIHDLQCVNLNPATNVMNPRAEAMLSRRLGSRASLGYPGDKYETGLEAVEQIEVIAAELAAEVFGARFAEVRVGSGALANLYTFMAVCRPGDTIIAPPASIGGHITHHAAGAAGRYGVTTVPAPVDADGYTVDVAALRTLAEQVRPTLITIGGSLNLFPHPVAEIRAVADTVGATVLFDAAHQSGIIAGGAWPNPLADGAHVMTMSTYKSLGGPPSGLIVTNDGALAETLEAIAYPGLTANFDAGKTAALAQTLLDWKVAGRAYAAAMISTAGRLAAELTARGVPVYAAERGGTTSHQLAVRAQAWSGGQHAAALLREANLLACGIGLPVEPVEGDTNGLRIGTPETARLGMGVDDMGVLAGFIAAALAPDSDRGAVAEQVTQWRSDFRDVHFTTDNPT